MSLALPAMPDQAGRISDWGFTAVPLRAPRFPCGTASRTACGTPILRDEDKDLTPGAVSADMQQLWRCGSTFPTQVLSRPVGATRVRNRRRRNPELAPQPWRCSYVPHSRCWTMPSRKATRHVWARVSRAAAGHAPVLATGHAPCPLPALATTCKVPVTDDRRCPRTVAFGPVTTHDTKSTESTRLWQCFLSTSPVTSLQ